MKLWWRIAGISLLFSLRAWGQPEPRDLPTFKARSEEVLLDVLALDRKTGRPVGNLRPGDFRLSEDGIAQPLTSFSQDELPLSVVLLFDLTDTVRPVLKPLAAGARAVLEHLKREDEVAVMVFSSSAQLLQDFTTDRGLAAHAVAQASRMESRDATFLNEDLFEAVGQARSARSPNSRRVLVWLTDGTANTPSDEMRWQHGMMAPAYLHTEKEATRDLLASGAVVTAVIEESDLTEQEVARTRFQPMEMLMRHAFPPGDIRRFAELTGGIVLSSSAKQTSARLAALLDEIRSRYTLGYRPLMQRPAGTFCSIQLQLTPEAAARLGKITLRTRAGYYRSGP